MIKGQRRRKRIKTRRPLFIIGGDGAARPAFPGGKKAFQI
jgi:hypothetical protein